MNQLAFLSTFDYMPGTRDYRSLVLHPYNIGLVLLITGLSMLFIGFSGAYLYNRIQSGLAPVRLPWIFFANIITLLASSWALNKARHCYIKDKTPDYERYLGVTVLLSLVFLAGQVIGWITLFSNNVQLQSSPLAAYLYVLSFIHLLHVVAGLPFLVIFWLAARQRMKEEVSVAVYFSDPDKRLKLRLLMMYWHFLDILWIYLVVFLLINYII